jgi:hypothetical protein
LGWKILPNFRRTEDRRKNLDEAFDRKYGVDTGGVFRPKKDEVVGDNWALGGNYQAIDPLDFERVLVTANVPYQDFTFIDMGSGKGRTVLIASKYNFKRVIGVEYCPKLNEIARKNLELFPANEKRSASIEIIDADASKYELPNEPLLILLNNPFSEPVMKPVVDNVVASFRKNPRRIVIIYFWPNLAKLWEDTGLFRKVQEAPAIFDTSEQTAPVTNRSETATAA